MHRNPDTPGVITHPPFLYVGGILAGVFLERIWPLPVPPLSEPVRWAGIGMIAGAFLWMLVAAREFRRARTSFDTHKPDTAVIRSGPFRLTRNPLYVGLTTITAGIALAKDRPWILVMLVPVLVLMHWGVIFREEKYLERKFGREYLDYRESVPRWFW